ncbi:hypothetical protein GCM10025864_10080 [Luteimicrobium album]|uniref:Uncharacterized protein n=1 Tax=Luteimicrobium album TaxID=1054550 RepID=A0ABQ6HZW1_9MICO|nr:hypothetical protein GCM10025864_10080 [Luteimicrobium album]
MPIVGMNCDTIPVKSASGRAYGVRRIVRKTNVKALDSAASTTRDVMKSDALRCAVSHSVRTSVCRFGVSRAHTAARNRGPAADR